MAWIGSSDPDFAAHETATVSTHGRSGTLRQRAGRTLDSFALQPHKHVEGLLVSDGEDTSSDVVCRTE